MEIFNILYIVEVVLAMGIAFRFHPLFSLLLGEGFNIVIFSLNLMVRQWLFMAKKLFVVLSFSRK